MHLEFSCSCMRSNFSSVHFSRLPMCRYSFWDLFARSLCWQDYPECFVQETLYGGAHYYNWKDENSPSCYRDGQLIVGPLSQDCKFNLFAPHCLGTLTPLPRSIHIYQNMFSDVWVRVHSTFNNRGVCTGSNFKNVINTLQGGGVHHIQFNFAI